MTFLECFKYFDFFDFFFKTDTNLFLCNTDINDINRLIDTIKFMVVVTVD